MHHQLNASRGGTIRGRARVGGRRGRCDADVARDEQQKGSSAPTARFLRRGHLPPVAELHHDGMLKNGQVKSKRPAISKVQVTHDTLCHRYNGKRKN